MDEVPEPTGGVGGRRYQVTAVLLTYAAVSMAFIPMVLHYSNKKQDRLVQTQRNAGPQAQAAPQSADDPAGQAGEQNHAPANASGNRQKPAMSFAAAAGKLAVIGLVSPFLELQDGLNGIIGLVILLVGMQFAWKMTAARGNVVVTGPFGKSAAASA